jgi:CDP-glucose 4,6-dehydratase
MSPYWQGKTVFVTGATGMVGSWLVKELLAQEAQVAVLVCDDDPQSELIRSGDVRKVAVVNGVLEDFSALERALGEHPVDTVFHLGAQTIVGTAHRFPLPTFETNIRGSYNLLEACRRHSERVRRVVVASSDKAYGEQPWLPYDEEMPLNGRYPYEVSKSCADLIAQAYHRTYGLPVAIARCGNVYGGGDLNWSRIVPGTIRSFLGGERPVIRSDGTYVRDYVYVVDIARAYMRLAQCLDAEKVQGEAFNFSTENPLTVLELVDAIQRLLDCGGLKPDIRSCAEGEIHSQHLSAKKARALLQWTPEFDLDAGLRSTIAWYRDFFLQAGSGDPV